ncbi:hypothetical protein [Parasedimentitalea huanghaiensis]|uniref:Uncharacterized protein n=1 Tax=Parasedimentitalea huanghaiensis TaxID=2682100 RepID=A0A6L6WDQ9_9RHOB|nr:hypothetical protein [Zongyanglinia huanghaiensis]MVO15059.1 hypothetical protein [Zongyanglinia huanghaiensis]
MGARAIEQPNEWARLGFAPGQALRMFGMRRSGNHAIANWLQRNATTGRSVFLNNCKPATDPLKSFRAIELDGELVSHQIAQKDLASVAGTAGDGAMLLISYEDVTTAEFAPKRAVSGPFDETLLSGDVLIYRSFLNWAASLLKKMQANTGYSLLRRNAILLHSIDIYSGVLRQVEQAETLQHTCICYDDWMRDESYRAAILNQLNLPVRDNTLGRVQRYGGGSSFQKEADSVDKLQTNRRWQQMAEEPEFAAVLQLAAHDTALTDRLERLFPRDAALLARIAGANSQSEKVRK